MSEEQKRHAREASDLFNDETNGEKDPSFESKVSEWKSYAKDRDATSKLFDEDLLNKPVIDSTENECNRSVHVDSKDKIKESNIERESINVSMIRDTDGYLLDSVPSTGPSYKRKIAFTSFSENRDEKRFKHEDHISRHNMNEDHSHPNYRDTASGHDEYLLSKHVFCNHGNRSNKTCPIHDQPKNTPCDYASLRESIISTGANMSAICGKIGSNGNVYVNKKNQSKNDSNGLFTGDQQSLYDEVVKNLESKIKSCEKTIENLKNTIEAKDNAFDELKAQIELIVNNEAEVDSDLINKKVGCALKIIKNIRSQAAEQDLLKSEFDELKLENIRLRSLVDELVSRLNKNSSEKK